MGRFFVARLYTFEHNDSMRRLSYPILLIIIVVLGIGTIWFFVGFRELLTFHNDNQRNRVQIIRLRESISLDDSYIDVLRAYWKYRGLGELKLDPLSDDCWAVRMPYEVFSTDWVLYIGFQNERISGIIIRTSDGPRPADGPDDIGMANICGF